METLTLRVRWHFRSGCSFVSCGFENKIGAGESRGYYVVPEETSERVFMRWIEQSTQHFIICRAATVLRITVRTQ